MIDHLTVARVAAGLGVSWHTANIAVDEHVWRHTKLGDKYVTVIIDLTPVRGKTGPARLLDVVEGRSQAGFKTWLAERPDTWRDGIEVVALDGFTGFTTATAEEIPTAVTVMDPFHVVRLAGDALDTCRGRVQRDRFGRRGRKHAPLYKARRTLHTGAALLTENSRPAWRHCSPTTGTSRSRRPGASTGA